MDGYVHTIMLPAFYRSVIFMKPIFNMHIYV